MLAIVGDGPELLAAATVVAVVGWLLAAAALYLARQPDQPPVGPRTLELGPEPPAIANFLVHRFRPTDEAVPATLLDLAARGSVEIEQRGPGVFYVRLHRVADATLTAYELRVLRHLEQRAHDGVVPAQALATGSREQSRRWRQAFVNAVVADAQRRGLSRERLDSRLFTAFGAAALLPAGLVWAFVGEVEGGLLAFVGALGMLGWIKARHPQEPTPEGSAAASRWLGVRAELAENEVFETRSPLEVPLWDRLLAYGAALGVAGGASEPLPMGVESDHEAWSTYGGAWRSVRIRYPRHVPLGWGLHPVHAFLRGFVTAAIGATPLVVLAPLVGVPDGWALVIAAVGAAMLCAAIGVGVVLIAMAIADMGRGTRSSGPILRLRAFGSDKRRRHYVAVDDGQSPSINALIVDPMQYARLTQGETVTVNVTRTLRAVRSIETLSPMTSGRDSSSARGLDALGIAVSDE